jgi:NAD(P)-dependent dehydrogenase (short-subunit alcohol dehydrogenase family)
VGRQTALALSREGYAVVLVGRRKERLEQTAGEFGQDAPPALVAPADVADPAAVRDLFEQIRQRFGRLDVLFNNAGTGAPAIPLEQLSFEQWKAVVDVNLSGVFLCIQGAFQLMKSQDPRGGRIINNGSISAHTPRPGAAAYTATKHAVTGLTKQTALDCRGKDIVCGQIDIGNAATPLTERMVQGQGVLQPDGRMMVEARMDPDAVGRAVVYMAGLPLDTNVLFMTVMANAMPFVGRG